MMLWYDVITDLICEFARIFIITRYCNTFFEKKDNKFMRWSVISIVYVITVLTYLFFHNIWLNIIVTYLGMVVVIALFKGKVKKKILFSIVLLVISVLIDIISAFLITENPNGNNQDIISSFISVILFLISVIFAERLSVHNQDEIKNQHWIFLLIISVASILSMIIIIYDGNILRISALSIAMVFVAMNLIIYYLYSIMTDRYISLLENKNLKNQLEAYEYQIQLNVDNEKRIRIMKHDMKHHLRELKELAKSDCHDEIIPYLDQMLNSVESTKSIVETKNISIDGVLNYMGAKALKKGILLEVYAAVPEDLKLNAFDFNIILGNLIENSIEASEKVKKPKIVIDIRYELNCIFIMIKNKYNGIINKKGEKIITSKDKNHGLGLESIKNIVEKYNGENNISYNDEEFSVNIILYL